MISDSYAWNFIPPCHLTQSVKIDIYMKGVHSNFSVKDGGYNVKRFSQHPTMQNGCSFFLASILNAIGLKFIFDGQTMQTEDAGAVLTRLRSIVWSMQSVNGEQPAVPRALTVIRRYTANTMEWLIVVTFS